jgi:hypothetical protein
MITIIIERLRSTSDLVWTSRWMMAMTAKFDMTYNIAGMTYRKPSTASTDQSYSTSSQMK